MKTGLWTAVALMTLAGTVQAGAAAPDEAATAGFERTSRMHTFPRIDGWRAIDDDTLIIWATPLRPYLVKLSRRSTGLRFTDVIGVTSTAGTVYEKFDNVIVDGLRYPIEAIYKIDARTARNMHRRKSETT